MGVLFCGCSKKVEPEEKKVVVEELSEQPTESIPYEVDVPNKLQRLRIPKIDFFDLEFIEAVGFLRNRAAEDEDIILRAKGIGFKISFSEVDSIPSIELNVKRVSMAAALRYICLLSEMNCELDGYGVKLVPRNPQAAWDSFGQVLEEKGDVSGISEKLRTIMLPRVDFEGTSLMEAVDYLRLRSEGLDTTELDPSKKGINFVVYVPKELVLPRIDELRIRDSSFEEVLKQICSKTGMRYELDAYSVILIPKDLN